MTYRFVIKKPIITEKSIRDASFGTYTFEVIKEANKSQIRQAIEQLFKVHVKTISTLVLKGKKRLVGRRRMVVKKPDRKKARVRLNSGEKIDLFEVGQSK